MNEPLVKRRELLEKHVLPKLAEPIRYSPILEGRLKDLIHSVKAQKLEGLVAKRSDSRYEPGERSGAWLKMRVNQGQEFVIGGYRIGGATFDALVFGYYDGGNHIYGRALCQETQGTKPCTSLWRVVSFRHRARNLPIPKSRSNAR